MTEAQHGRCRAGAARPPTPGAGEIAAVIALMFVLAAAVFGAGRFIANQKQQPRLALDVALDGSGSVDEAMRKRILQILDSLVFDTLSAGSSLTAWEYDRVAQPIYSGTPRDSSDLWPAGDWYVHYSTHARGTCPASALEQMFARIAEAAHRGQPAIILLLTDGEDSDAPRTAVIVRRLVALGNVRAVWIMPVDTNAEFRAELQRSYASFLPDRLIVSSRFDIAGGIGKLQALLRRDS